MRRTHHEHGTLRTDLGQEEEKAYRERRRCGKMPQCSGTFRLMQRPKTKQRSTAVAELQGWRREEDEEEGTKGKGKNDPSVLFIRQQS